MGGRLAQYWRNWIQVGGQSVGGSNVERLQVGVGGETISVKRGATHRFHTKSHWQIAGYGGVGRKPVSKRGYRGGTCWHARVLQKVLLGAQEEARSIACDSGSVHIEQVHEEEEVPDGDSGADKRTASARRVGNVDGSE